MVQRRWVELQSPTEIGSHHDLAYSLWLPEGARAGVVILHGAASRQESHHDFARLVAGAGLAVIAFDARGHGESAGPMGAGALDDVAAMVMLLRARIGDPAAPVALRGSSLGGYLAILAAAPVGARAVVAICPASGEGLRRALHSRKLEGIGLGFEADTPALEEFLGRHDLGEAVTGLEAPLLLLHAEGDEQVPVEHSRELAGRSRVPGSRLITVPGGHHRSVQHDPELQAASLRFIEQALTNP